MEIIEENYLYAKAYAKLEIRSIKPRLLQIIGIRIRRLRVC